VSLIAIERLLLALATKTGLRVRGVPVDIMVVIVPLIFTLMFFFQPKQVHPGDDMGGVDDVEAIGNKAPAPGLLHHLIEQFLKAFRPRASPEAAQGGKVVRQLLGTHPQEPLVDQVKGGLFLDLDNVL